MTPSKNDRMFYLETLKSTECQCEGEKKRGRAVCFSCWRRLPENLQRALYRPIGRGFEAAYEAAYRHLNDL